MLDVATGNLIREITAVPLPVRTAFSPDGERLAISTEAQPRAVVVDIGSGEEAFSLVGHQISTRTVAWSPDGRWIATSSDDASARIWDAETGAFRFALLGHTATVQAVDWSPDAGRLVTGSDDGTARVWQIAEGGTQELFSLGSQGTRSGIKGVAFAPDGDRVITGDEFVTAVNVWDVSLSGDAEWANLPAVPFSFGDAEFTPDGSRLVASSAGGSTGVWDPESGERHLAFGPACPAPRTPSSPTAPSTPAPTSSPWRWTRRGG